MTPDYSCNNLATNSQTDRTRSRHILGLVSIWAGKRYYEMLQNYPFLNVRAVKCCVFPASLLRQAVEWGEWRVDVWLSGRVTGHERKAGNWRRGDKERSCVANGRQDCGHSWGRGGTQRSGGVTGKVESNNRKRMLSPEAEWENTTDNWRPDRTEEEAKHS